MSCLSLPVSAPINGHGMRDLAERFLYTPYWDAFNAIAVMAGLGSIVVLIFGTARSPKEFAMMWAGLALLFLCVAFSMVFEEILPILPSLPEHRRIPYVLSFPGFIVFLVLFICGGRRLVSDVLTAFSNLFRRKTGKGRDGGGTTLLAAMRPGATWLGMSVIVFLASVVAYHGPDVTLGWAGWGQH